MTQEFVTLPREVVEHVRGALAYVGVGNAFENPNLAQSTCKQVIWKLDHALRVALEQADTGIPTSEQPQVEQEPFVWLDTNFGDVWEKDAIALYGKPAGAIPLYTHPQPAQKPLTDDQVLKAVRHLYQSDLPVGMGFSDDLDVARAIEAAHNIK